MDPHLAYQIQVQDNGRSPITSTGCAQLVPRWHNRLWPFLDFLFPLDLDRWPCCFVHTPKKSNPVFCSSCCELMDHATWSIHPKSHKSLVFPTSLSLKAFSNSCFWLRAFLNICSKKQIRSNFPSTSCCLWVSPFTPFFLWKQDARWKVLESRSHDGCWK